MINKAILLGHVGNDPEIRTMNNGDKVANFSLATSETWKDKNTGEKKQKTEWHKVAVFGRPAELVEKYVNKGSKLYIEGKIKNSSYEKDGQTFYKTEVVLSGFDSKVLFLDKKEDNAQTQSYGVTKPSHHSNITKQIDSDWGNDINDEVPF